MLSPHFVLHFRIYHLYHLHYRQIHLSHSLIALGLSGPVLYHRPYFLFANRLVFCLGRLLPSLFLLMLSLIFQMILLRRCMLSPKTHIFQLIFLNLFRHLFLMLFLNFSQNRYSLRLRRLSFLLIYPN